MKKAFLTEGASGWVFEKAPKSLDEVRRGFLFYR
jgi:hypothetical protein